jgi:hypothetical protein
MLLKHLALAATFCAAATSSFAQTEYFPLQVGNQWVFQVSGRIGADPVVLDIPQSQTVNGREYFMLRSSQESTRWLRMGDDGTLYSAASPGGPESVWHVFSTAEGGSYQTSINPCNQTAVVESKSYKVTVPAGDFVNALRITYPGANCADAGLVADVYAPYVGLIQREFTTLLGAQTWKLSYSRTGGVTVLSGPEQGFSFTLDQTTYTGNFLTARLTVRNTQAQPLALTFPTGQQYDLVIRDVSGKEVYRWSAGKLFTQVLVSESIVGERNWTVLAPLNPGGQRLPAGNYTAEGIETASTPGPLSAIVPFTVR